MMFYNLLILIFIINNLCVFVLCGLFCLLCVHYCIIFVFVWFGVIFCMVVLCCTY